MRSSHRRLNFLLTLTLLTLAPVSLVIGQHIFTLQELQQAFHGEHEIWSIILWELRMPRLLLALITGASLGLAGAAMQGLVRNPLAEPGILGVSSGAALGAVTVYYAGYGETALLPMAALAGALFTTILVIALAGRYFRTDILVLSGIAISAVASAAIALMVNLTDNPFAVNDILFWLMGSLSDRAMVHVWLALPLTLVGWALLLYKPKQLTVLALGEDVAATMGVHLKYLKWRVMLGTAFCVGSAVAVTGVIGFVGLIIPHLIRPLVGHEPGKSLLPSMIGGALLVILADMIVRLIDTNMLELRLGVITALLGTPFFLMLIIKLRKTSL
jgi:iron complex transport system permease protein